MRKAQLDFRQAGSNGAAACWPFVRRGGTRSVEEIVTARQPPLRKVWRTIGVPRLLVIGEYRMGIEITPQA